MASKTSRVARAARDYLANASDRDIARITRLRKRSPRRGRLLSASNRWEKWEQNLLGNYPDADLARKTGRPVLAVSRQRWRLGIPRVGLPGGGLH